MAPLRQAAREAAVVDALEDVVDDDGALALGGKGRRGADPLAQRALLQVAEAVAEKVAGKCCHRR